MSLPNKYSFLENIGTLPKMVAAGLQLLGIKEYPGTKSNNPLIMNMAKELGIASIYPNDEVAWCAVAMCYICKITGKPQPFKQYEILRAKSFEKWGNDVPEGQEQLGDILVFTRDGGSHVALYIAESKTTFFCLGGNQGNSYSIVEIKKDRLSKCRRFYATAAPDSAKKYIIDSNGHVSTNEA